MSHNNKIRDTETHFIIDPATRRITTASSYNNTIVQYDHNSERLTFEMPRYVDGHDMIECDDVRIHYRNGSSNSLSRTNGVYIPDDLAISEDDDELLTFSWLLSAATTAYIGYLHFSIQFICLGADGETVEYAWNTGIYKDVSVVESINNAEEVVVENADAIAALKKELLESVIADVEGFEGRLDKLEADINYEKIAITTLTASTSAVEVGSKASVTVTCVLNKKPKELTLNGNAVTLDTGFTVTYTRDQWDKSPSTTTYKVVAKDEKNTVEKSVSVKSHYLCYYGEYAAVESYDATFITDKLPSSKLLTSNTRATSFDCTTGAGQHIYYAVPSTYGACTFTVGGWSGGFDKVKSQVSVARNGLTVKYDIYRSNNANLGKKTVVVS